MRFFLGVVLGFLVGGVLVEFIAYLGHFIREIRVDGLSTLDYIFSQLRIGDLGYEL